MAWWNPRAVSEQVAPLPRSLRNLLDGEMEHSAALRQEVDSLKKKVAEQEERHVLKVQALARYGEPWARHAGRGWGGLSADPKRTLHWHF